MPIRREVVRFGEMLPEHAWSVGLTAVKGCDLFLSIETTSIVFPAVELPLRALENGATVVHTAPVALEDSFDEYFLQGTATRILQSLLAEAFG